MCDGELDDDEGNEYGVCPIIGFGDPPPPKSDKTPLGP